MIEFLLYVVGAAVVYIAGVALGYTWGKSDGLQEGYTKLAMEMREKK